MNLEELFINCINKSALKKEVSASPLNKVEAMRVVLKAKYPQSWRAAWTLKELLSKNDPLISTHLDSLIELLRVDDDSLQREVINMISSARFDDEQEGRLFEYCLVIWRNVKKSSSVRITAFKVISSVIKKYPELKSEVELYLSNEYSQSLSPGIYKTFKNLIAN